MTDREVIDLLGREAIKKATGVAAEALKKWRQPGRGIPWQYRPRLVELAASQGVAHKLPAKFLFRQAA